MVKDQKRQQLQPQLFLCWHELICTEFTKANKHFLRPTEENVEIADVRITLINLAL